ncbi:MAG: 3-deoxy-8-phosphooctulonate synthase [Solitalea-like symbiont of Acarus siro]
MFIKGKKIVHIGDINCGSKELFLIAGPCVIEEDDIMLRTADMLKRIQEKLKIPIIYKSSFSKDNRTKIGSYTGPGLDAGLKILERIKKDFSFPVLTDIHYPYQALPVSQVCDVIQIPAFLCMQTELLAAAAKTKKAINIKKGQFIPAESMIHPINKCKAFGNDDIMISERGFVMGYGDLVVDPRSLHFLNETLHPVIFDVTHSIRKLGIPSENQGYTYKKLLPVIARAGVAAGIDGLFIETHPESSKAKCDSITQINTDLLEDLLKPLLDIHNIINK